VAFDALQLQVVSPDHRLIDLVVEEAQLPGLEGYLGILPGHAALMTELGIGELSYRRGKELHYAVVIGGFAEVLPDRVTVLGEKAERAEEIDVHRARAAKERAEKRMATTGDPDMDWNRAAAALKRAMIRLQVAAKGGGVAAANEESHVGP